MILGTAIGIPFSKPTGLLLPVCVRDSAIAWYRDLNDTVSNISTTVEGLLDFDGVNDEVRFSESIDISGDKTISFKMYLKENITITNSQRIITFYGSGDSISDHFIVWISNATPDKIVFQTRLASEGTNPVFNYADLVGQIIEVSVVKTSSGISSISFNGVEQSLTLQSESLSNSTSYYSIGNFPVGTQDPFGSGYIWDLNINDDHSYLGIPNGNQNTAWEDQIGAVNGTVYGSPTTTNLEIIDYYVRDSIGTRTDTIYYGQYLDQPGVSGVLDFDGTDDSISLSSHPDVTGDKTIVFNARFESYGVSQAETVFVFGDNDNDYLEVAYITNLNRLRVAASTAVGTANGDYDISSYIGINTRFVISKTTGDINSVTANGDTLSLVVAGSGANSAASGATIGHHPDYGVYAYFNHGLIWDISVGSANNFIGYPAGNTDTAWDDTIGVITATVNGTPSTTDAGVSIINLYRTTGTYDYTDPSDGYRYVGNSIPGDGLVTVPANGICEIGINKPDTLTGYLSFDGVDDYISGTSVPNLDGSQIITFKVQIDSTDSANSGITFVLIAATNGSDRLVVFLDNDSNYLGVYTSTLSYRYAYSGLPEQFSGQEIEITITKTDETITSVLLNGVSAGTPSSVATGTYAFDALYIMGRPGYIGSGNGYTKGLFYDLDWNSTLGYTGYPNGELDTAWEDTVGSNNGTVHGTPVQSGVVFDGTNFSDYENFYPIVERAGSILHDIMQDSKHISVSNPSWGEALYGSDYLNQYGYVSKADSSGVDSTITGLLDFDGINDYVELSSIPSVAGNIELSFSFYINSSVLATNGLMEFNNSLSSELFRCVVYESGGQDYIGVLLQEASGRSAWDLNLTTSGLTYLDTVINLTVTASNGIISSVAINDDTSYGTISVYSTQSISYDIAYIGRLRTGAYSSILLWDININNENTYAGYPDGNLNTAWLDTTNSNNGTVSGSPTTTDLIINTLNPPWETLVNGSGITLDDDCLVPLAQWQYENLIDSEGELILDSEGEIIQVKVNL